MAELAINLLRRENQKTRVVLNDFEAFLRSLESTFEFSTEALESLTQILRHVEMNLTPTLRIEEEVFYPALKELFSNNLGPLTVLKGEHDAILLYFTRVREVSTKLKPGQNPQETVQELEEWGWKAWQALHDHLYKEEQVLYPVAAGFLTEQVDAELAQRIANRNSEPNPGNQKQS